MSSESQPQPAPIAPASVEIASDLSVGDLIKALSAGWRDFLAQPKFGLFFASTFAIAGIVLSYLLITTGETTWLIPVASGFPLIAPFTAVGLYEVSRRREAGLPLGWGVVLGALNGRGDGQILSMGVIMFVAFGFWMIVAHAVFAIFLAEAGLGSDLLAILTIPAGIAMLVVGTIIGGVMALVFYMVTVISLPMLVDRGVDFITAIIASLRAFRRNRLVLLIWAAIVAGVLFLAMLPLFVGLLVALPVLGHATWHLYQRVTDNAL